MPTPPKKKKKSLNQLLVFLNLYQHVKNQFVPSVHFRDILNFRVAWPDWPHPFLTMPTQKFVDQLLIFCVFVKRITLYNCLCVDVNNPPQTAFKRVYTAYTYSNIDFMNGLEEVELLGKNECTLHRWPRSPVINDSSRPYQ